MILKTGISPLEKHDVACHLCFVSEKETYLSPKSMIYQGLHCVTKELDAYLVRKFSLLGKNAASLNTILNQDGTIPDHNLNKIILSLINLEHETNMRSYPIYAREGSQTKAILQHSPPYNFNLDVLITAVFESVNYDEGLKFLSESLYFFQRKHSFNPKNTPHLYKEIEELNFELIKLSYHQEHSLWGALGAKYMPSVLFKVRLLSFQNSTTEEVSLIADDGPGIGHKSITNLKK